MSGYRDARPHWADPIEAPDHPSPLAFIGVRLLISVAVVSMLCFLVLSLVGGIQ